MASERKKPGPKPVQFDIEKIENLAALGMTQEEIAYALGSNPETWFKRIREGNTAMTEAFRKGKGRHATIVFGGLSKAASQGNVAALIYLSKVHFGRRENVLLTHEGNADGAPIAVQAMTAEQRKARLEELERKRRERQEEET